MNILLIQARCGSSRLPKKVLLELNNKSIIKTVYDRCRLSDKLDKIIVLTSTNIEDDLIQEHCNENGIDCYRGDERDLLNRYYYLSKLLIPKIIIRVTCDCPFIDYRLIDKMIDFYLRNDYDYIYNTDDGVEHIYPEGSDLEIFSFDVLENLWKNEMEIREHATGCIRLKKNYYDNIFKIHRYDSGFDTMDLKNNFYGIHLSIDSLSDYKVAEYIFNHFNREYFSFEEILKFLDENYEEYSSIKKEIVNRIGQKLYKRAKEIIPGGTQLLSKRPEMFLPDNWPSYYSKVEGIEVTDLDGNKYIDMSINGVGSCILGANDKDINNAVIECINRGNMSTLNHPNEVGLTEKLIELHPWAGMARYTRASGEACSVAVRIARAHSKKYKIAFCGYHGWHDWYLATNINSNGLDKHLIAGLSSSGVPPVLEGTIYPFTYNKIEELEGLLKEQEIGVIIMEPMRSVYPEDNFLGKVRELADKFGCVLIFDEVSSGFRITDGGLHKMFGVNPDMAIFGKAISNGFPLGVVLGKKDVMEAAQDTFISSTYWTEGIGFTAGLNTINKFIRLGVSGYIREMGEYFQSRLREIIARLGMNMIVAGLPCIITFSFNYKNPLAIKTLFNQEMLKNGYLTTLALYMTYAHNKENLDKYLGKVEEFLVKWKDVIEDGRAEEYLDGPIAHGGFSRLN